jgi:transcriptional regulator with XRE-family HTH domain
METFGKRLRWIRNHRDITQSQLANRLNISRSHIANIESDKKQPSDIIISAICNEFDVNEAWIRSGEGEPFLDADSLAERFVKKHGSNPFISQILNDGVADPATKEVLTFGVDNDISKDSLSLEEHGLISLYRSLDRKAQSIVFEFIKSIIRLLKE